MPAVSVIIPARNAAASLVRAMEALRRQELEERFEVIVVVDPDDPDTAEAARRGSSATVLTMSADAPAGVSGPGAKRNFGAEIAQASALAFTDADCLPAPDWLAEGLRALESADLVQGIVTPPPGVEIGPYDRVVTVGGVSPLFETANMLVRRELFERLGGFEDWANAAELGGRPFGEDAWFGWRARRAGASIVYCPSALVHHEVFRRSAVEYIAEHARRAYFPPLARRIPELRDAFFYRRWFLSGRSAAFDGAMVGALVAAARRSPWPLVGAIPYAAMIRRDGLSLRRPWTAKPAFTNVAADAIGLASLAWGSVRARRLLL